MRKRVYQRHIGRKVIVAPGHEKAVLDGIRTLSMACKEGVFLLEEELGSNDPDLDERCGLLADRHEVYALQIPGCRGYRLALSIDLAASEPCPATIHGALPISDACASARRLATLHLALINPTWE